MIKKVKKLIKKIIRKACEAFIVFGKKHELTKDMANKLDEKMKTRQFMNKYYNKCKVNDKMIIFESFWARQFSCSPKALYLAMVNDPQYKDYKKVWAFRNPKKYKYLTKMDPNTIIVKYNDDKYFKYHATAKYIVRNTRLPEHIVLKPEQKYVQCWHGTPLKRLGCDIKLFAGSKKRTKKHHNLFKNDAKRITYLLSPSDFYREKITSAFALKEAGKEDAFIQKGYPRNDFLYSYTEEDVQRIKTDLNLPEGKKIILYAPTWRDNQQNEKGRITYELGVDFDKWKEVLSDEYIVLFRTHYFISNKFDFSKYEGFIYDVSKHDDVNELYVISDLLITDYSSVFFDYANLNRPIIFYMYDFDEYKDEMRGFYFGIEELPGPILKDEKDLVPTIQKLGGEEFVLDETYIKFNEKFNQYREPCSAAVLKEIIEG